jgi:hypothetical protein
MDTGKERAAERATQSVRDASDAYGRRQRRLAGKFGRMGNVIVREVFLEEHPDLKGKEQFNPNNFTN